MNHNNTEIERKFLVKPDAFELDAKQHNYVCKIIAQGYWNKDHLPSYFHYLLEAIAAEIPASDYQNLKSGGPEQFELRVRQSDEDFFVTFKGRTELPTGGIFEYEYPLEQDTAQHFLSHTDFLIEKHRHLVPLENDLLIEVDVFHRLGLILAEIEIPSLDTVLPSLPEWMGEEVTGQPQYLNRYLAEQSGIKKKALRP